MNQEAVSKIEFMMKQAVAEAGPAKPFIIGASKTARKRTTIGQVRAEAAEAIAKAREEAEANVTQRVSRAFEEGRTDARISFFEQAARLLGVSCYDINSMEDFERALKKHNVSSSLIGFVAALKAFEAPACLIGRVTDVESVAQAAALVGLFRDLTGEGKKTSAAQDPDVVVGGVQYFLTAEEKAEAARVEGPMSGLIEAIKKLRQRCNLGLKEAKDVVEAYRAKVLGTPALPAAPSAPPAAHASWSSINVDGR